MSVTIMGHDFLSYYTPHSVIYNILATHRQIHVQWETYILPLTHSHIHAITLSLNSSPIDSLSLKHTRPHCLSPLLSLSLPYSLSLSLLMSLFFYSFSISFSLSLPFSLSLSHPHSLSPSLSLSLSNTCRHRGKKQQWMPISCNHNCRNPRSQDRKSVV